VPRRNSGATALRSLGDDGPMLLRVAVALFALQAGFEATILATIVGILLASLVALADTGLASSIRAATPTARPAD
jgi:hypothetical protein